jgi:hypothetical protein
LPYRQALRPYDCAVVRRASVSKRAGDFLAAKALELPVSIDFLGRAFSAPLLIRIAAGYEAPQPAIAGRHGISVPWMESPGGGPTSPLGL